MRRVLKIVVLSTLILLPAEAGAEGFFIPWAGGNFGNAQAEERGGDADDSTV